jgi:outer membrane protein OmpA-like peptidoglycan-associated protein
MKPLSLLTALTITICACGGEVRQSADPKLTSAEVETTPPGWPSLGRGPARFIRIDLGPDALAQCQRVSPKFPFDSAQTFAQDRMQLRALAGCLELPEMRSRKLLLVGRADPSGADTYNDKLGLERANAIKQILIDAGISADRIDVASVGEKGAFGDTSEYSSGFDRRVDILVLGGAHAPAR